MKNQSAIFLFVYFVMLSGCTHLISFDNVNYSILKEQKDAGVIVVIDQFTLGKRVNIKSFMTGIAHNWNAMPGQMLKQVADIELPQLFKHYELSQEYGEPKKGRSRLTLVMTIPRYDFSNFQASFTVRAIAYGHDKKVLFDKEYLEVGISQGGKMFWGGAFAMKSAIRQSSLDALKKIFISLRSDLMTVLTPVVETS